MNIWNQRKMIVKNLNIIACVSWRLFSCKKKENQESNERNRNEKNLNYSWLKVPMSVTNQKIFTRSDLKEQRLEMRRKVGCDDFINFRFNQFQDFTSFLSVGSKSLIQKKLFFYLKIVKKNYMCITWMTHYQFIMAFHPRHQYYI